MEKFRINIPFWANTRLYTEKKFFCYFCTIAISVFLNIFFARTFYENKWPIFLDNFFISFITFSIGMFPAVVFSFVYNLFIFFLSGHNFYAGIYGINGILLSLIITLFFKRRTYYPIFLQLLITYVTAVLGQSVVGGLIDVIFISNKVDLSQWQMHSWFSTLLVMQGIPFQVANIVGRIPLAMISDIICVLGGFFISKCFEYLFMLETVKK